MMKKGYGSSGGKMPMKGKTMKKGYGSSSGKAGKSCNKKTTARRK